MMLIIATLIEGVTIKTQPDAILRLCNLSCIMCWNGNNPRTQRVSPDLLEKIETQLGPHLSVMVPFSGIAELNVRLDGSRFEFNIIAQQMPLDRFPVVCFSRGLLYLRGGLD